MRDPIPPSQPTSRRMLAKVPGVRSAWHLGRTLRDVWLDGSKYSQIELQEDFSSTDPWQYASDNLQVLRHCGEIAMLDRVRGTKQFGRALEVGCAEGIFTEALADRCDSLLSTDFYEVVLQRAKNRRPWGGHVRFSSLDLRAEPIPGNFDLIVAIHVLEYVQSPFPLRRIRKKIVDAMRPGGYLLLGCVSFDSIVEQSWWSHYLLRGGKEINAFFATHPQLSLVDSAVHPLAECDSLDILLQKTS